MTSLKQSNLQTNKVTKAIFPVAGFGTRCLPATKAQPKEMMNVVDKPAIQYLVEDASEAGIEDVIFVTGRGKRAIEDHFDYSFELDQTLVEKNKLDLVKQVRRISELARFSYVRQPMPLGDGHAINCAAHLVDQEPVLIMFGDTLYDSEESPAQQVIRAYERYQVPIIGLASVPDNLVDQFGVIDGPNIEGDIFDIKRFVEKPKLGQAPSSLAAVGVYVITPEIFQCLHEVKNPSGGEIRLADAFSLMLEQGQTIYGLKLQGTWLDTGSKVGLLKAGITLGLKHSEVQDDLKLFLKNLIAGL